MNNPTSINKPLTQKYRSLDLLSKILAVSGMVLLAIFNLVKNSVTYPEFLEKNGKSICFGLIILGPIVHLIYCILIKDRKKTIRYLITLIVLPILLFLIYLISK